MWKYPVRTDPKEWMECGLTNQQRKRALGLWLEEASYGRVTRKITRVAYKVCSTDYSWRLLQLYEWLRVLLFLMMEKGTFILIKIPFTSANFF